MSRFCQSDGRGSGPEIFLKRFTVSGSLGISFIAFVCSSEKSGEGSAPVVFVKIGTNSESLNALRIASANIWTWSLGVLGGKMKGEPINVKFRCISTTFLTLSFFTNLSNVGKPSKAGWAKRYPCGISSTTWKWTSSLSTQSLSCFTKISEL